MAKITITRALTELKTLEERIFNESMGLEPMAIKQGTKLLKPFSDQTPEVFIEKAKAKFQKIQDLMNQIEKLKNAIGASNQITKVIICGEEMTVAEALTRKKYMSLKADFLVTLKNKFSEKRRAYDVEVEKLNTKLDSFRTQIASSGDRTADEIDILVENQKKAYGGEPELLDPIALSDKIENLEKNIEDFKMNVDYALSESNAKTEIEI